MEEWKAIPGYEGLYEASNLGRIRTAEGKTTSSARFPVRVWKQRIMKQKYAKRKNTSVRDARVCLWKEGKEKTFLVSRLIAMTWCDGYQDGLTVNHKDGNPENNNADNLEWLSLADNIRHGFKNGLYKSSHPCTLVDSNGKGKSFRSLCEASLSIGRNDHYIACCISANRPIRSVDGDLYGLV